MRKTYLVLENGVAFKGVGFGANIFSIGELVFTTGMSGHVENLTDPSNFGQIIVQTFPTIGSSGVIESDLQGRCHAAGYVVREWCEMPSNFRTQYNIDEYLKSNGIPGVYGVDTRQITRIIRDKGVLNAIICKDVPSDLQLLKAFSIKNAVEQVTIDRSERYPALGDKKYRVVLIDYGTKKSIINELQKRGCQIDVVPSHTSADSILASKPDGVVLSNGPGNPAENIVAIKEVKELLGKVPMFGICLGHQLMALANGAKTERLKHGHRGANQPVKDLASGRVYITSQNHGYTVISESVKKGKLSCVNANDNTCEGINYNGEAAFSVQFQPEACPGPSETDFLFDKFIYMMGGRC